MAFRINKQGAWERYGLILWFDRFDRFGRTAMASVCFLTFFISLMVAAPFIYYAREHGFELLNYALSWVLFVICYAVAILVLQNLLWLLIRGALWLLEEV
jgi:hypothetical protein